MHLGKDELNKTAIEKFNSKYFKKDSFWETSGLQPKFGKSTLQARTDHVNTLRSEQFGNLLQRDGAN